VVGLLGMVVPAAAQDEGIEGFATNALVLLDHGAIAGRFVSTSGAPVANLDITVVDNGRHHHAAGPPGVT
jgi:hypothetical protein